MPEIPNWRSHVVTQKRQGCGCVPAGFEYLLRIAGVTGIDYSTFQDNFDLAANNSGQNSFTAVAAAIRRVYPQAQFDIRSFTTGEEKNAFLRECVRHGVPVIASVAR